MTIVTLVSGCGNAHHVFLVGCSAEDGGDAAAVYDEGDTTPIDYETASYRDNDPPTATAVTDLM
jgi:hypothetical protein